MPNYSFLPLLPSGRQNVPCVNKKTYTTHTTGMITVSVPHCPHLSLPCGCKPGEYCCVPVVFPVRKALFASAHGSG